MGTSALGGRADRPPDATRSGAQCRVPLPSDAVLELSVSWPPCDREARMRRESLHGAAPQRCVANVLSRWHTADESNGTTRVCSGSLPEFHNKDASAIH